MCRLAGHRVLWTIWMFIPIVNLIPTVIMIMRFARMRGHRRAFGLLLMVPLVNYVAMWVLGPGRPGHRMAPAY